MDKYSLEELLCGGDEHICQLLKRMKMDCDYFLGYGCGYEKHL